MPDPVVTPVAGYYTGVLDMYYAKMTNDESASVAATYGTPAVLAKSINVTITPRYREGSRYASNARVRNVHRLDGYDVSFAADQVLPAVRRDVLGRTADSKGVEILDGDSDAPYLAIGFAITMDNGEKELWWLYKGKFNEVEVNADTEGEGIEYKDVNLSGSFDRRIKDNRIGAVLSTDAEDADATTVSGWFTAVYEKAAGNGGT